MQGRTDEKVLGASKGSGEQPLSKICSNSKKGDEHVGRLIKATFAEHMIIRS